MSHFSALKCLVKQLFFFKLAAGGSRKIRFGVCLLTLSLLFRIHVKWQLIFLLLPLPLLILLKVEINVEATTVCTCTQEPCLRPLQRQKGSQWVRPMTFLRKLWAWGDDVGVSLWCFGLQPTQLKSFAALLACALFLPRRLRLEGRLLFHQKMSHYGSTYFGTLPTQI